MEDRSLSIIIVNWNTNDRLIRCLDSIESAERNGLKRLEVIVVDNASKIKFKPYKTYSFTFKLLQNSKNKGFAKACNQGALTSQGEYLLFLNPDTRIGKNTLVSSVQEYERLKRYNQKTYPKMLNIGALGVQMIDDRGNIQKTCSRLPKLRYFAAKAFGLNKIVKTWDLFQKEWDHKESRFVEEIMGAFFFMERSIFQKMGGFDEQFFMYYEEVDLCKRLHDSGYTIYYTTDTSIYHETGAASGQIKGKRLFYELRSRYLYFQKHFTKAASGVLIFLMKQEQLLRYVEVLFGTVDRDESIIRRQEINHAFNDFYEWRRKEMAGRSMRK